LRVSPTEARFEVEIPYLETKATIAPPTGMESRALARQLTVLLVEPDLRLQKQIVQMLSDRGDRVVPVVSAEEAADLAVRLRFDLTLCAVRLPGLNWVEFFERVRRQVGTFVLLTEGYDSDLARAFQGGEGFVLAKPVDSAELDKIRRAAEDKHAVRT
jgi:CheY-like chemotaxis protein